MIKRYRWTLVIGTLFVLWLAFGAQIIDRLLHDAPPIPPVTGTITPELGLTGTLFYTQDDDGIVRVNLESGTIQQWWTADDVGEYAHGIAVTASGDLVVAIDGALYRSGQDVPDLQLLRRDDSAYLDSPFVAGDWLYYTRYAQPRTRDLLEPGRVMRVERVPLDDPDVSPQVIVADAEYPAVQGDQLVYIAYDPQSADQSLWIADVDGSNSRELVTPDAFRGLIAPYFHNDNVIFGASGDYLANAAGNIAHAHGPPWSVWAIPQVGGTPDQVLLLSFDGPWTAVTETDDLFVLDADGVYWVGAVRIERLADSDAEGAMVYLPANP